MSAIGHYIARRYLARAKARHLREFPQVACFSFDLITDFILLDGQYERDELALLARTVFPRIAPGAACLDVGANIGNHALHFARHFDRVVAFEPHPRVFRLLSFNAELAPNLTALNFGASSAPGRVEVAEDRRNLAASGIGRAGTGASVSFELVRIDDVPEVRALPRISFIKVDVEGHEHAALEGARETILRHRPLIALEVLPAEIEGGTAASVEFLKGLGYAHFYEPVAAGRLGRLPRGLRKAARSLTALVTGRRPSKAERLAPVARLEPRSYLMLLCAAEPLDLG
jgi:FkbM family methyltransferase